MPEGAENTPVNRSNLFLATRAGAASRENHLTEFVASALRRSECFRTAYAQMVLAERFGSRAVLAADGIDTQAYYKGLGTPDLRLRLADGTVVLCEHKIDAEETTVVVPTSGGTAEIRLADNNAPDVKKQLRRYLDVPGVEAVVYFRDMWKRVDDDVRSDPRFLRPAGRDHFIWRDLHPALTECRDTDLVVDWLCEAFEVLGWLAPHPEIGALEGDAADVRKNQESFAALWGRTRAIAAELGWTGIHAGSRIELYLEKNTRSLAEGVWISPSLRNRFRIRFTPRQDRLDSIFTLLSQAAEHLDPQPLVEIVAVPRKLGATRVVELSSSLAKILGNASDPPDMEERLSAYVSKALQPVQVAS